MTANPKRRPAAPRRDASGRRSASGTGPLHNLLGQRENLLVLLTIAAVVVALLLGNRWLTPILLVAAGFPVFCLSMRQGGYKAALAVAYRWSIAAFLTMLAAGAFVRDRLGESLPFAEAAARSMESWIVAGGGPVPVGYPYLLFGMLSFVAGSALSGGLVGFAVGAVALGTAAYTAAHLFHHGLNIVQIALVAVPLWQYGLFAGCITGLVPAAAPFYRRVFPVEVPADGREQLRRYAWIAVACLVLSVVMRLAVAGPWLRILQAWTVF